MSNNSTPTMAGFAWSGTPVYVPAEAGEDGWCMRDAVCKLFGWDVGSEEWSRFIEGPQGKDTLRLVEHLGLTLFSIPEDWDELILRSAHPGVALFIFPTHQMSHVVYVPDVQVAPALLADA